MTNTTVSPVLDTSRGALNLVQVNHELEGGARFVTYEYCVSLIVVTLRPTTAVQVIRRGRSARTAGLPSVALSLIAGWWGFPFGPIYTVATVIKNLRGGTDVTAEIAQLVAHHTDPGPTSSPSEPASTMVPAPADWLPDPSGRHRLRYWDGERWTAHVSDQGDQGYDTMETD